MAIVVIHSNTSYKNVLLKDTKTKTTTKKKLNYQNLSVCWNYVGKLFNFLNVSSIAIPLLLTDYFELFKCFKSDLKTEKIKKGGGRSEAIWYKLFQICLFIPRSCQNVVAKILTTQENA